MTDIVEEINVLEVALIALQEGASDEKRMAMNMLERLLERKTKILEELEMFVQLEDGYGEGQVA